MKKILMSSAVLVFFLSFLPAYAAGPQETVKSYINQALQVLQNQSLKSQPEAKKKEIVAIFEKMFDETELSRWTLGRNWNKLTPAQQQEFIQLYRQVLERAYMDKILSYTNEKVVYTKETTLSPTQAEVQTKIITSSREIPVNYRLLQKDGAWRVYDVVIENVSLVQNYRSQFSSILSNHTPEQMLEILRKKVKGQS